MSVQDDANCPSLRLSFGPSTRQQTTIADPRLKDRSRQRSSCHIDRRCRIAVDRGGTPRIKPQRRARGRWVVEVEERARRNDTRATTCQALTNGGAAMRAPCGRRPSEPRRWQHRDAPEPRHPTKAAGCDWPGPRCGTASPTTRTARPCARRAYLARARHEAARRKAESEQSMSRFPMSQHVPLGPWRLGDGNTPSARTRICNGNKLLAHTKIP